MGRPASSLPRITFRLSEELLAHLQEHAEKNERSLNAEIVDRLEASAGHIDAPFTPAQEIVAKGMVEEHMQYVRAEWDRELDARFAEFERQYHERELAHRAEVAARKEARDKGQGAG